MRVAEVRVAGLFDTFDHHVRLHLVERITIIHGTNGVGKTTLLLMLRNALSGRFEPLSKVPFTEFEVKFDDGQAVRFRRTSHVAAEERHARLPRASPA